jgi:hypothetical protein
VSFFCLLWVPLFYLFRRSISNKSSQGGAWALILGSVMAAVQYFAGDFINPGGFGFYRWLSGFVDIICAPVLAPLVIYIALLLLGSFSEGGDFGNFALLWLIPSAVLRSVSWSAEGGPLLLVAAPLLWTALAVGISFFINVITEHNNIVVTGLSVIGILALPAAASGAYWAFFSQQTRLGFLLFFAAQIPLIISVVMDWASVL